jgi:phenylalanyl-tRNA synthetase beta chain
MRTTLTAGLVHALARNLSRGQESVRLFEVGETFTRISGEHPVRERRHVAALWSGRRDGWLKPGEGVDLFDIKGALEELLGALGHTAECVHAAAPWLHPNLQAEVRVGDRPVGVIGELHPDLMRKLAIDGAALVFEIDLDALPPAEPARGAELPRFPSVTRDLSFFVDAQVSAAHIRAALLEARDPLCVDVKVIEDFRDAGKVPAGKKGMLWSLVYRAADRTLTDAEVQSAHDALLTRLKARLELILR